MSDKLWTVNGFSEDSGIDRRALTKWLDGSSPAKVEGRAQYYSLPDIVAAIRSRGVTHSANDEEKTQRIRRLTAQADQIEMENRVREGELVGVVEISEEFGRIVMNAKTRLLALPSKLAPLVAHRPPAEVFSVSKDLIYEALTELSQQIAPPSDPTEKEQK